MGRPPEPPEPHDGSLPDDSVAGELGALLGGRELGDEAVERMRAMLSAPVDEDLAAAHLSAIFAAADEDPDSGGGDVIDLRSRRRNRALFGGAVVATVLSLTGGLAAAGTLPDPVQNAVASVARVFSVDLPSSDDDPSDDTPLDSPASTAPGRTGQTGTTPGDTAPGRSGTTPGDTAPGRTGTTPGDTAPGRTGETPGSNSDPPVPEPPRRPDDPGNDSNPPGGPPPGNSASEDRPRPDPSGPAGDTPANPGGGPTTDPAEGSRGSGGGRS